MQSAVTQFRQHRLDDIGRDGKADTQIAPFAGHTHVGHDGSVHTDQSAARVKQGPAGVTGIDGSICLHHREVDLSDIREVSPDSRDDAERHG